MLLILVSWCSCTQSNQHQEEEIITMKVKIVSLAGCTATPPTLALVRETAKELAVEIDLEHVVVTSKEEAVTHRHIGSPTVQVNGLDIDPEMRKIEQFGIS